MKIVVAADEKEGIGFNGGIPWRIPEDMARFKALTMGGVCVMGRKTWDSLPAKVKPFVGRQSIVMTHRLLNEDRLRAIHAPISAADMRRSYACGGFDTVAEAIASDPTRFKGTVWVIGGGQVYAEALRLGLVDEIYLTRVQGNFGCDVFWPGIPEGWKQVEQDPDGSHDEGAWRLSSAAWLRFEKWVRP